MKTAAISRIQNLRKVRDISREELADKIGVSLRLFQSGKVGLLCFEEAKQVTFEKLSNL